MTTWNSLFFQSPVSYLSEMVTCMYEYVSMMLLSVFLLVCLVSLNFFIEKSHSQHFYQDHSLEVVWTIVPMFILLGIVAPSLTTLYMLDSCSFCGLTVGIFGHQWYWTYGYKDILQSLFDSYMLPSDSNYIRLLDVDNRLVLPTALPIRLMVGSADVIHSWTVPSFGVKMDAVPGRINQFCFSLKRSGVYFGQCSEICGSNHSFMPIVVESVPLAKFLQLN